jgi:protein-disulfide isomerase
MKLKTFALATILAFSPQLGALAAETSPPEKAEIEKIVREYLITNPELLTEMANLLEAKQKDAETKARGLALTSNADAIFRLPGDAIGGNEKGDVTLVEFMDYNCGWCKKSVNELSSLLDEDKQVRVVFKEFPIFGEGSEYAAKAALASRKQGKYWEFHRALFTYESQVTAAATDEIAVGIGLDLDRLKKDMDDPVIVETIQANQKLAKALLIGGTPAFVIDGTLVPGYIGKAQLAENIASVRSSGGCKLC